MLWIHVNNQGVADCIVNVGNKIRQGDAFEVFIVQGDKNSTGEWVSNYSVSTVGYISQASEGVQGRQQPSSKSKTFILGNASQANSFFVGGTTYSGYYVKIPDDATNPIANGGHIGLEIGLADSTGEVVHAQIVTAYVEPTYGQKNLSITLSDFDELLKAFNDNVAYVQFYDTREDFPANGSEKSPNNVLYIARDTMALYLWDGDDYQQFEQTIELSTLDEAKELVASSGLLLGYKYVIPYKPTWGSSDYTHPHQLSTIKYKMAGREFGVVLTAVKDNEFAHEARFVDTQSTFTGDDLSKWYGRAKFDSTLGVIIEELTDDHGIHAFGDFKNMMFETQDWFDSEMQSGSDDYAYAISAFDGRNYADGSSSATNGGINVHDVELGRLNANVIAALEPSSSVEISDVFFSDSNSAYKNVFFSKGSIRSLSVRDSHDIAIQSPTRLTRNEFDGSSGISICSQTYLSGNVFSASNNFSFGWSDGDPVSTISGCTFRNASWSNENHFNGGMFGTTRVLMRKAIIGFSSRIYCADLDSDGRIVGYTSLPSDASDAEWQEIDSTKILGSKLTADVDADGHSISGLSKVSFGDGGFYVKDGEFHIIENGTEHTVSFPSISKNEVLATMSDIGSVEAELGDYAKKSEIVYDNYSAGKLVGTLHIGSAISYDVKAPADQALVDEDVLKLGTFATVDEVKSLVTQTLKEGTEIGTIAGVPLYAPAPAGSLIAGDGISIADSVISAKVSDIVTAEAAHEVIEGSEFVTADLNEDGTKVQISLDSDYRPHVVELTGESGTLSDDDYAKLCGPTSSYTAQILLDDEFYLIGTEAEETDTYVHANEDSVKTITITKSTKAWALTSSGIHETVTADAVHAVVEGSEFITADLNETSDKVQISLDSDYRPHVVELSGTSGTLSEDDYNRLCGPTSSYTAQILLDEEFYAPASEREDYDTYSISTTVNSTTTVKTITIHKIEEMKGEWDLTTETIATTDAVAASYATKAELQSVEEIAEGRSSAIAIISSLDIDAVKTDIADNGYKAYYGETDITSDVTAGSYDDLLANGSLNVAKTSGGTVRVPSTQYLATKSSASKRYDFYLISSFKLGDIVYTIAKDILDWWYAKDDGDGNSTFHSFDAETPDLSEYAKTDDLKTVGGSSLIGTGDISVGVTSVGGASGDVTVSGGLSVSGSDINGLEQVVLSYDGSAITRSGTAMTYASIKALVDDSSKIVVIKNSINNTVLHYSAFEDDALWFFSSYKINGEWYLCRLIINSSDEIIHDDDEMQQTLISGTNIKTVNGSSILGSGNVGVGVTSITAGTGLTGGTITGEGTLAVDTTTIATTDSMDAKDFIKTAGGANFKVWSGTQTAYDALSSKDATTLYIIVG